MNGEVSVIYRVIYSRTSEEKIDFIMFAQLYTYRNITKDQRDCDWSVFQSKNEKPFIQQGSVIKNCLDNMWSETFS